MDTSKLALDRRTFVAGATAATVALAGTTAAAQAAESAKADKAAASAKAEAPAGADAAETCDVVVCGCGASGFMAAYTAAKDGAKVIVVEKGEDMTAPNGVWVSGPFAVGTDVLQNKEGGTTLTVDDAFTHVMDYTHWTPNPALARRCLVESHNAVANLEEIGYEFKEANFRFETPFHGEKGGFHLITTPIEDRVTLWSDALANVGAEVLFSTAMTSLVTTGDAVTGIMAKAADGSTLRIDAKAVIIATGGYLGNEDLQERFLHTRDLNVARGGTSLCTGDGILAAEAVGAALEKTFGYCPCEYGGTNDKASRPAKQDKFDQNYAFKFGYYGNLLVDAEGKRFLNEGLLCDYPMSYGSEQTLHNNPWYAIVDQTYVDAMTTEGLYDYMTARGAVPGDQDDPSTNWFIGNYFKDRVLDKLPEDIEEGIAEGWLWKGDTIEEVAEKAGLPVENVVATVERYNGYCETGVDEEFGTSPWYLSPVKDGPFYITQNYQSAWSTFGGLRIDDQCRVLAAETYLPIDGLYCVGTEAGSLYYSPYYDIPGYCYGLCIDSGYIAATEACAYAGVTA